MEAIETTSERNTSAEEAYEEVLRRLRDGLIGAEDRIVDKALAAELNMSRMPAREALLRLVTEGYLVGTTRGFKLPTLSKEDILEIFDVRLMLEPRAAASAAAQGSGINLTALEAAFNDARVAWLHQDVSGLVKANTRFRSIWMDAVRNRRLVKLVWRFVDHVIAVRTATLYDPESRNLSVSITAKLLDGFKRYDTLYVHDQMQCFIEAGRERFLALSPGAANDAGLPVPARPAGV
jgi:DNA-binding GntR family transcriptional regulator